jgi:hypothetical protein
MLIKQLLHLSPRTRFDCRRRRIKFTGRVTGAEIVAVALIAKEIDVDCRRRRIKFTGRVTAAEGND